MAEAFKYKAFISYSHKDQKWASWLHRRLENYKFPDKTIGKITDAGPVPKSLKPIFRDREELTAGSSLGDVIESALDASENLIVICSPNAVASHWVNQEILYFKRRHGSARIFTVIIDGEPFASDLPDGEGQECLPRALRFELGDDGELSDRPAEPLAADLRSEGDGRRFGTLKLISGMVGLGLDDLVQRDLQRARRRVIGITSLASAVVLAMGSLTWLAVDARGKAEQGRERAEGIITFMLTDLRDRLEPVGRLDALDAVGQEAAAYYDSYDAAEHSSDDWGRRAEVLHLLGDIQLRQGKIESANSYILPAFDITKAALEKDPENPQRIYEHAQSVYWVSVPHLRAAEYSAEKAYQEEYLYLAKRLQLIEGDTIRTLKELGYAHANLGASEGRIKNYDIAFKYIDESIQFFENVIELDPSAENRIEHAGKFGAKSRIKSKMKNMDEAVALSLIQMNLIEDVVSEFPDDYFALQSLVRARSVLGQRYFEIGELDKAKAQYLIAEREINKVLDREPANERMKRSKLSVFRALREIARQEFNTLDVEKYSLLFQDYLERNLQDDQESQFNFNWDYNYPRQRFRDRMQNQIAAGNYESALELLSELESLTSQISENPDLLDLAISDQIYISYTKLLLNRNKNALIKLYDFLDAGYIDRFPDGKEMHLVLMSELYPDIKPNKYKIINELTADELEDPFFEFFKKRYPQEAQTIIERVK